MIPVGTKVSYLVGTGRKWGRVLVHVPQTDEYLVSQDGAPTTQRYLAEAKLTAPTPEPDPPTAKWPTHGVSTGYKILTRNDADHNWELDQIRDVGAQFVRVDSTASNQTQVDRLVTGVVTRNMEPLLILHGSTGPITEQAAAAFATSQATKWKGRVRLFEFCNEPDLAGWTPEQYTMAARAAYTALKQANPDAILFVGALWKWKDTSGAGVRDWVRRMYAGGHTAGIKGHMDALSLHLYDDPFERGDWNIWDHTFHLPGSVRSIMDANGDQAIPIVSTENGGPANKYGEQRQAEIVTNNFRALQVYGPQRFVMHTVFSMTDDDSAGDYGLLRSDRSRRPGWDAYRAGAS